MDALKLGCLLWRIVPRAGAAGRDGYRRRVPAASTEPAEPAADADGPASRRPRFSLEEAVGGPLGIAEATLPFLAFTIAWTASGRDVTFGAIVAVALTATLTALRLARRETTQFALSGLAGVALGAFVASRTGEAENFFLPGILINAGMLLAYLTSIAIGRPLLGLILAQLTGEGPAWHREPERRRLYTRASWIWVGVFSFRLSIQVPLYLTGAVAPLAVARVVTGLPIFALALFLSYLILRPLLAESGLVKMPPVPGGGS